MPREANEADAPEKGKSESYKNRNLNERTVHQEEGRQKKERKLADAFFVAEAAVRIDRAIKIAFLSCRGMVLAQTPIFVAFLFYTAAHKTSSARISLLPRPPLALRQ
ncbi:hypothetical protein NPIL_493851 [Nephila pilipes]|uniref:Uncharacterized protein n=1 Tax=Nephila pilipes TaxID=299642 RepID=A0A8X6UDQ2_NEPPI|nr:hypothetical protein NPIL_493851 [Nephila pilipes]